MEDEATQPATQQVIDPRRIGQASSGLSDEDLTEIFCILHPISMTAYRATALIAEESPQHTIHNMGAGWEARGEARKHKNEEPDTFDLAAQGIPSRDIALRLSADLKDPLSGFRFGRNQQRCDFVIGHHQPDRKISNVHFRIYINEHGIIMLEDQSTNGTVVEHKILRGKEKENGADFKHVLSQGTMVALVLQPLDEDMRFVVRIPQRDGDAEDMYDHNLRNYLNRIQVLNRAREAQIARAVTAGKPAVGGHGEAPDIFAGRGETTQVMTSAAIDSAMGRTKEWRGGAKYNKLRSIGKGAFANVYLITAKFDGTCYAAKELEKRRFVKNGILDQKVENEMIIMRKIRHRNIVQYIEHVDWNEYLYLIMEYVPQGDLGEHISQHGMLTEPTVKIMASQLLSALKYLHHQGITHRDIKPDNILLQSRSPLHVKLTDFGLSKMVVDDDTFMRTFCGTLLYCAPEVYTEYREYDSTGRRNPRGIDKKLLPPQRYGHAVDIWSTGAVLFYSMSGSPPYPAKSGTTYLELLNTIMTKPLDLRPLRLAGVSQLGIYFVQKMLEKSTDFRPTVTDLELDHWFDDFDASTDLSLVDDTDEVDLIGIHGGDGELDRVASQLSIRGANDSDIGDATEHDVVEFAKTVNVNHGQRTPHSYQTGSSSSDESYTFMKNPQGNPRLFGEVNPSFLASSGVIPQGHLNIPVDRSDGQGAQSNDPSPSSVYLQSEPPPSLSPMEGIATADIPATAPPSISQSQIEETLPPSGPITAPSLLGAESLVGMLVMDSPSPVAVNAPSPMPRASIVIPNFRESIKSLRRQREDGDDPEPDPKRVMSKRIINDTVPPSAYWDAKDRSTWHNGYPVMTLSEYGEAEAIASQHGESFKHGNSVFDKIVGAYKITASVSPEPSSHAQSEKNDAVGRQQLMKRDDRKLGDGDLRARASSATPASPIAVAEESNVSAPHNTSTYMDHPGFAQFQPPRRILAKLTATSHSTLPNITIGIFEPFISWGRASINTVIFPDGNEPRIPKTAFKIVAWKPGCSVTSTFLPEAHQDLSFWISTKATVGIRVNGVKLKSHDYEHPYTDSKYWGELRSGDFIDVWNHDHHPNQYSRLRFDCFWGKSCHQRPVDSPFNVTSSPEVVLELDSFCLQKEKEFHLVKMAQQKNLENNKENLVDTLHPA